MKTFLRHTGVLAALLLASSAMAQQVVPTAPLPCNPSYSNAVKHLADKYGEAPVGQGIASTGNMITILANDDTGTWTSVVTFPDGRTCLLASGENWESTGFAPIGEPA